MTRNRDSKFNICILHKINLYQRAGYQPNIILRSNDMESILMMVAAEEGISIVPGYSQRQSGIAALYPKDFKRVKQF